MPREENSEILNDKYHTQLTGFRGLAALLVLLTHAADHKLIHKIFSVGYGDLGVVFFFMLSGFLMTFLYIDKKPNLKSITKFIVNRLARVLPLFYVAICLYTVLGTFFLEDFYYSFEDLSSALNAFLLINAKGVLWAIPVEIRYYLFFIVLWLIYNKFGIYSFIICTILISVPTIYQLVVNQQPIRDFYLYAFYFNLGSSVHFLSKSKSIVEKIKKSPLLLVLLIFLCCLLNFPIIRWKLGFYLGPWFDPVSIISSYFIFLCVAFNHRFFSFLNVKILQISGEISYGIYLLHMPIMLLVIPCFGEGYLAFGITILLSYLLAWYSFTYFEFPLSNFIKNRIKKFI